MPAGQVDQQQLVVFEVQFRGRGEGDLGGLGGGQQLALGTDGDELAGGHGQRAGQEARRCRLKSTTLLATPEAPMPMTRDEVADQAVVGAEDRGAEGARRAGCGRGLPGRGPPPRGSVRLRPWRRGVGVLVVGGAAFGALGQGQDKDGAEMAGQEAQELAAERTPARASPRGRRGAGASGPRAGLRLRPGPAGSRVPRPRGSVPGRGRRRPRRVRRPGTGASGGCRPGWGSFCGVLSGRGSGGNWRAETRRLLCWMGHGSAPLQRPAYRVFPRIFGWQTSLRSFGFP